MISLKGFEDENFCNYKKPVMFLGFPKCSFKCGIAACQNSKLATAPIKQYSCETLYQRYIQNPITKGIVCGGLEPFDTFDELFELIDYFRNKKNNQDTIIIYTGYYEPEIELFIQKLKSFNNIVIKFGRYIPNLPNCKDNLLGVTLASNNQYSKRIEDIDYESRNN